MPNLYTCVWLNMYSTRRLFHNVSLSLMPSLIFVSPLSRDFTGKDSSQCFKFNTFPLQMKSEENNGQDQQEKLCSISVNSLSILSNEQIVLLPACFRSETRITNWWSLNLKNAGHSTWNTFNPNLPRRISSPTFDADVVVIRCQSALLCRSIILKHVYFFFAKNRGIPTEKRLDFFEKYTSGAVPRMV